MFLDFFKVGSFVFRDFAVDGDLDQAVFFGRERVQCGKHFQSDLFEGFGFHFRHVFLTDRAFVRALVVAEGRVLVCF